MSLRQALEAKAAQYVKKHGAVGASAELLAAFAEDLLQEHTRRASELWDAAWETAETLETSPAAFDDQYRLFLAGKLREALGPAALAENGIYVADGEGDKPASRQHSPSATKSALKRLADGCRVKAELYEKLDPTVPASFTWIADELDAIAAGRKSALSDGMDRVDYIYEVERLQEDLKRVTAERDQAVAALAKVTPKKGGFAFPAVVIDWDSINAMQFAGSRRALLSKLERFMSEELRETAYWTSNHFTRSDMYVLHELLKAASAAPAATAEEIGRYAALCPPPSGLSGEARTELLELRAKLSTIGAAGWKSSETDGESALKDVLDSIKEAKDLLVVAYKGGAYKSKINSALHRLTLVQRTLEQAESVNAALRAGKIVEWTKDGAAVPADAPPAADTLAYLIVGVDQDGDANWDICLKLPAASERKMEMDEVSHEPNKVYEIRIGTDLIVQEIPKDDLDAAMPPGQTAP